MFHFWVFEICKGVLKSEGVSSGTFGARLTIAMFDNKM